MRKKGKNTQVLMSKINVSISLHILQKLKHFKRMLCQDEMKKLHKSEKLVKLTEKEIKNLNRITY